MSCHLAPFLQTSHSIFLEKPWFQDFPGGTVGRLCAPNAGGRGLIPDQGTRSHTHDATKNSYATTRAGELQLRSLPAATKIQLNQINK